MTAGASVGVVIVAAGRSERMGFDKIWADLAGRPVLAWSIRELARLQPDRLVVVAAPASVERVESLVEELGINAGVVPGGARRRDSVEAGIESVPDVEWVAVHDAARPLACSALVTLGLEVARRSGASVPALPVPDTIKRVDGTRVLHTLDRSGLRLIQTPQVFRRSLLAWALSSSDDDVTDEAGLIESLGGIVYTFEGQPDNFKLTYPEDLSLMHEILRREAGARKRR